MSAVGRGMLAFGKYFDFFELTTNVSEQFRPIEQIQS
jgi:hypothetical protein